MVTANGIDHDVGANVQFSQILRFSINHLICTQPAHITRITAEDGAYDPQLTGPGQLHRIRSHIARAPVHDDGLTFTRLRVIEQHLPCRYAHYWQCCPFEMRQARWPASNHSRGGDRVFGVTVDEERIGGAKDLGSNSEPICIWANLFNNA